MKKLLLAVFFIAGSGAVVDMTRLAPATETDDADLSSLLSATSLRCALGPGATGTWESGEPEIETGEWREGGTVHYDQINLKTGEARFFLGNLGASTVKVEGTQAGLHFFEFTRTGNLVVSTVFGEKVNGKHPFVFSRHVSWEWSGGEEPFPSQWHGSCEVLF